MRQKNNRQLEHEVITTFTRWYIPITKGLWRVDAKWDVGCDGCLSDTPTKASYPGIMTKQADLEINRYRCPQLIHTDQPAY